MINKLLDGFLIFGTGVAWLLAMSTDDAALPILVALLVALLVATIRVQIRCERGGER